AKSFLQNENLLLPRAIDFGRMGSSRMKGASMWQGSPSKTGYLRAGLALLLSICGIGLMALAFAPAESGSRTGGAMTPTLASATKLPATLPPDMPMALTIVLNRAD